MKRKSLHVSVALIAVMISVAVTYWFPDLRKDVPALFGTVSGFATLYGVAFTIIEVVRARSAATFAAAEAKRATESVRALYGISNLSECQSCIEYALEGIDKDGLVLSSPLSRIVKLYIGEFHLEYGDEGSSQRENARCSSRTHH